MKLSRLLRSEDSRQTLDLTLRLTQRSVSSEFKGTTLGRLWSFINPLATIAIFALIFGIVFRNEVPPGRNSGIDSFALWIGIGVLSWTFFSSGIMASMNALVNNSGSSPRSTSPARSSSTPRSCRWPWTSPSSCSC